jgi:hypothetical protein
MEIPLAERLGRLISSTIWSNLFTERLGWSAAGFSQRGPSPYRLFCYVVAVLIETTRRQAATRFPGHGFAGPRRHDGSNPHSAERSPPPDHPAPRLRRPLRTVFRFVPSLRRSAGVDSFI